MKLFLENFVKLMFEIEFHENLFCRLYSFQQDGDIFEPVVVDRKALQSMQPGEVIVAKWPEPLRNQYFRNLLPDMSITKCESCNKMFHTDDYELQLLQKGHCPFCRNATPYVGHQNDSVNDAL